MRRLRVRIPLVVWIYCAFCSAVCAQSWPKAVRDVRYRSTGDGTEQPALFFAPKGAKPVPLLVGLHTWSSDYKQTMSVPYADWCIAKGWAFIHPNFRGPNRNPQATGSELVVADIVSAVEYAKQKANVDPNRIYLIGASGGGYACLLMAGRHPEIWAGVSAWVPIADLATWHAECKLANRGYWKDLEQSCGGAPGAGNAIDQEYRRRSALTYLAAARSVNLDINAGIHDGHTGSVSIGHSLLAFNRLVPTAERFLPKQIEFMVRQRRRHPDIVKPDPDPSYGDQQPLVRRSFGRTRVTIFDGSHEVIPAAGLAWLARQRRAWKMHVIDPATDQLRGADGVRLADANGDGRLDTVTGWEEGKAIRVCLHPGPAKSKQPWPAVTVGTIASAEDAVFVDLDGDGNLDVVSSTEGRNRTVYVHWAPRRRADYLEAKAWKTASIPATSKRQSWMFALPMDIDGTFGIDLVVGSKGRGAAVGWLQSPKDPRDLAAWRYHRIVDAGWIMSLRSGGKGEQLAPVFVSDRRGEHRGVYRLVATRAADHTVHWKREDIGGRDHQVMFLDLSSNGRPLVATRDGVILDFRSGTVARIPNPIGTPWGKAVKIGDLDGDGIPDIVHTANTAKNRAKPGVTWLRKVGGGWQVHDISGRRGSKFDRIELLDVDADGDLDVITCEENAGPNSRGLGLVWYENPYR